MTLQKFFITINLNFFVSENWNLVCANYRPSIRASRDNFVIVPSVSAQNTICRNGTCYRVTHGKANTCSFRCLRQRCTQLCSSIAWNSKLKISNFLYLSMTINDMHKIHRLLTHLLEMNTLQNKKTHVILCFLWPTRADSYWHSAESLMANIRGL